MKDEVLIKTAFSTVNPIDKILSQISRYEGFILGSEGCGIII